MLKDRSLLGKYILLWPFLYRWLVLADQSSLKELIAVGSLHFNSFKLHWLQALPELAQINDRLLCLCCVELQLLCAAPHSKVSHQAQYSSSSLSLIHPTMAVSSANFRM